MLNDYDKRQRTPGVLVLSRPFLESLETFSHPESHRKISKLLITELFFKHLLNIMYEQRLFHTIIFRSVHRPSVLDTDYLKLALRWARNVYGAFEKRPTSFTR